MQVLIFIIGFFILTILIMIIERMRNIKRVRYEIKEQYGKKPRPTKYNFEEISYYWGECRKQIPEDEEIDNITWDDLDMDKVYARINTCNSFVGEQVLYSTLHRLPKNKLHLEELEKKIDFFDANDKEREEIQLLLSGLRKDNFSYYLPKFLANLDTFSINDIWKYRMMQILLIVSILPSIVFQNTSLIFITGCIFVINIVIYVRGKMKYETHLDTLDSIVNVVNIGKKIINTNKFSYEKQFNDLENDIMKFKKITRKLSGIQGKKDAVMSGDAIALIYDYIIGGTLIDFVRYNQIIKVLKNNKKEYFNLYKKVGVIDMAISIASFRKSIPFYCTPTFSNEKELRMEEIFHPLIDKPVSNTANLNRSCIITGSNASGKSTYIKAVAINMILGQSINTCMARQITIPYARIITSMAVRDDLMAGESYFIKEIKYLNRIINNLSDERLVICAIDEILRGTNTDERIAASASILKYIYDKNCIAIVASHDIELTQILEKIYDNYHFQEQMQESDIAFDYKIYKGPSTSKNAIKLLEYVGFPDEIVIEARNLDLYSTK